MGWWFVIGFATGCAVNCRPCPTGQTMSRHATITFAVDATSIRHSLCRLLTRHGQRGYRHSAYGTEVYCLLCGKHLDTLPPTKEPS